MRRASTTTTTANLAIRPVGSASARLFTLPLLLTIGSLPLPTLNLCG